MFALLLFAMATLGVFLHSYPDGTHQSKLNVSGIETRRLFCPEPEWLKLRRSGLPSSCGEGHEAPTDFWLKHFAIVKVKTAWQDVLTHLTEEEFLGLEFFQFPTDYFSLEVINMYALQTPVKFLECVYRRLSKAPDGVVQVLRQESYVTSPVLTKPNDLKTGVRDFSLMNVRQVSQNLQPNATYHTIRSLLNEFDINVEHWTPISLPVVQPLYELLTRNAWACIPCLGRWLNFVRHLSPDFQLSLGPPGNDQPDGQAGKLSIASLQSLMMQIQAWAPKILQTCDDENRLDLQLQLYAAARWILNVMANLPRRDKAVVNQRKNIYSSLFLVRSILATRLIPSYVCMKTVCLEVIGLLFPNLLDQPLEDLMQSKHLFPSDSSKSAMRLFLDSALLLWRRDEEEQCEFIRFGGADSSPQHGHNWLLSSSFFIDRDNVVHVFRCLQRMIEDSCARLSHSCDDEQSRQSRKDHLDVLSMLRREHDLPVALGHQAESTAHKCAAMLHKFALRISVIDRQQKLRRFTSSFFSFCSDMGVEIGIGDFRIDHGNLEPLLPPWLLGGDFSSDLPVGACAAPGDQVAGGSFPLESDVCGAYDEPAAEQQSAVHQLGPTLERERVDLDSSSMFLPQALRIPGSLHIINNALEQVTESLSHWQEFLKQLKLFEALWSFGRLQRFVNYCLRPSVLSHKCDDILRQKLGSLYTKRWGEVVYFCIRLKAVLPILRSAWDEKKFLFGIGGVSVAGSDRQADEAEAEDSQNMGSHFQASLLTQTLRDPFFFAYFDMILSLVSMTEDMAHWAESCSCHEDLLQHTSSRSSEQQVRRSTMKSGRAISNLFSGKAEVCPMRGKRLPELVAYGADKMFIDFANAAIGSLFVSHRHFVSSEQWHLILSDFQAGKDQAVLQFQLKFNWTNRLPYKLALLAYEDQALARRELRQVACEYDEQPEDLQQHHHFLTQKILRKGSPLRSQFDSWLSGVPLQKLLDLEFQAGCFRLVQVTERLYESTHSILKRRTPPNASGPLVSLQLRLLDVAAEVRMRPDTLAVIASKYDLVRESKKLPFHLGLEGHPLFWSSFGKRWKVIKALSKVIYRADPIAQFPDVSHLDAAHQQVKKKDKALEMANARKGRQKLKLPLSYNSLRACALHSHFLAVADSFSDVLFAFSHHSEVTEEGHDARSLPLQHFKDVLAMSQPQSDDFHMGPDVEVEVPPGQALELLGSSADGPPKDGQIFFRVVNTKPSSRRLLSLDPAAAGISGRLQSDDVAVCFFLKALKLVMKVILCGLALQLVQALVEHMRRLFKF